MTVTNREAEQWNRMQQWMFKREIDRSRKELIERIRHQNQSNTPEGASGCSQAVVSHEGRAVAARGSRPQSIAGTNSARATVSTTAAAPTENPGSEHQAPLTGPAAGARLHLVKQIVGQRGLF